MYSSLRKAAEVLVFSSILLAGTQLTTDVAAQRIFNQTAGFIVNVDFSTWSNFGEAGGCVTCPYTCVKPTEGPGGALLNFTDATQLASIPDAYRNTQRNGCCFANPGKAKSQPTCQAPSNPPEAEDCGYTYGPSLSWSISSTNPPKDPVSAILFASVDCETFFAIGREFVKQSKGTSSLIKGSQVINGGCYGDPQGVPIVLAGCLTTTMKFDKSASYTWQMLAERCMGLSGQCSRTNGLWGRNLKCCTDLVSISGSKWDLAYPLYTKKRSTGTILSGPAIFGIVFGGVALMMCLVHYGREVRDRARKTALIREQEANEDYAEIITPLVADGQQPTPGPMLAPIKYPVDMEVSLHEGDRIFHPDQEEVLFEGQMS